MRSARTGRPNRDASNERYVWTVEVSGTPIYECRCRERGEATEAPVAMNGKADVACSS